MFRKGVYSRFYSIFKFVGNNKKCIYGCLGVLYMKIEINCFVNYLTRLFYDKWKKKGEKHKINVARK